MTQFSSEFTKDDDFWGYIGQSDSLLAMSDEQRHKERFRLVASLFSAEGVQRFEPKIRENVGLPCPSNLRSLNSSADCNILPNIAPGGWKHSQHGIRFPRAHPRYRP